MKAVAVPDTSEIDSKTSLVVTAAEALEISNPQEYVEASGFLQDIKGLQNEIDDTFDTPIKLAHEAHKSIIGARNKHRVPLEQAEMLVKKKVGEYQRLEEKARKEQERKLLAETLKREEEARKEAAKELEQKGKPEEAKQVLETPVIPPPVVLQPQTPKIKGITTRETWKFRITNSDLIPKEYMTPDVTKIRGVVRAMKGQTNIPGIEAYPESTVSAKAR
jgi:hypothetical protein